MNKFRNIQWLACWWTAASCSEASNVRSWYLIASFQQQISILLVGSCLFNSQAWSCKRFVRSSSTISFRLYVSTVSPSNAFLGVFLPKGDPNRHSTSELKDTFRTVLASVFMEPDSWNSSSLESGSLKISGLRHLRWDLDNQPSALGLWYFAVVALLEASFVLLAVAS